MKPSERIGNLLSLNGEPTEVTQITKTEINGLPVKKFKPIPLTEDWQKKLGIANTWVMGSNTYQIQLRNEQLYIFSPGSRSPLFAVECKYVHTLQNILFDLTGKDPKIS